MLIMDNLRISDTNMFFKALFSSQSFRKMVANAKGVKRSNFFSDITWKGELEAILDMLGRKCEI